jgi:hypothetical protein
MVVAAAEGETVAPLASRRWHTACEGAVAAFSTIVRSGGCEALLPQTEGSELAGVRVKTQSLLGTLECGSEPGQVALLDVALRAEGKTDFVPSPQISCGEDHLFSGLPGGTRISVSIVAFNAIGDTIAGTTCRAVTVPGTTVIAECNPLSQLGTLRVDLEAALAVIDDIGFNCDDSITDVLVRVAGEDTERSFPPPDCLQPFDHGFLPGQAQVNVSAIHQGEETGSATCEGEVKAGKLTLASCHPAVEIP